MTTHNIKVRVHANGDDALIAWHPEQWPDVWVGFALEKRNPKTGEVTTLNNRIPPKAGEGEVPTFGLSSEVSPIRRCIWTDHEVGEGDEVEYRVIPMRAHGEGFARVHGKESEWTGRTVTSSEAGDGLSAFFNRGTVMSQVVSRLVGDKPTVAALKKLKTDLAGPGFPARRYLAGDARHEILAFLEAADRRGSEIYAALYECNDQELIDALKPFGTRGHVLIGNGSSTKRDLADELGGAKLEVEERDLSQRGQSSPSVHNKFVVECSAATGKARRVLTGSTNWTTTGLCTQLNNVLVVDRPRIAERFRAQWSALVAAGDEMPAALQTSNATWTEDGPVSVGFSATPDEQDLAPALALIRGAKDGLLFLMYTPGQSPLLDDLLTRSQGATGPLVKGVVSEVKETASGKIVEFQGRVIRRGEEQSFRDSTLLPASVPAENTPSWAREEFSRKMFFPAGLAAIVHSKVIVVDPFSDECAVITGSHNFSVSASQKNDENLVIVRGNKALAQAYAVHIHGVYDHYSWRAFLSNGGNPDTLFDALASWKKGGSRERDLRFWLR